VRFQAAILAVILVVAAVLRLIGLDWGLRHPPHGDESAFVLNVHRMIAEGGFDHRYYEYPGLFFYILYPFLRLVMGADPPTPTGYLAARAVVAGCGVAGVALQFAFARHLMAVGPALLSAALLAVSLVAVQTAHSVRPDVALQALYLVALIAMMRQDGRPRADLRAGAALGAAAAIKFSGVFLVPALIARRLLVPGRRARGLLLAGAAAAATFVVLSPYSLLHLGEFVEGVETQVSYHYEESPDPDLVKSYGDMVALYLGIWVRALGAPATALSLLGLVAAARAPRQWGPLLLVPATAIAVFATSQVRHDRFLLPALVVAFALAAAGWAEVWSVSRRLAILVAVVALALPSLASIRYVRDVSRPGTGDRAIDWAASGLRAGARVLTRLDLGLDESRVEVLKVPRLAQRSLVLASDFVFATHRDDPAAFEGLTKRAAFEPSGRYNGPSITVYEVPPPLRRRAAIPLEGATLSASSGADELLAAIDGDPRTWWHTDEIQQAGDFIAVDLGRAVDLSAVELALDAAPRFAARELKIEVRQNGVWTSPPWLEGRTRPEAQRLPASQLLLLIRPQRADAVRLTLTRNSGRRWGIAELALWHSAP
jgi:dolichyl-phosphate-mannose-protein mannosyltransferase/F5/8 type C domain-containing protein